MSRTIVYVVLLITAVCILGKEAKFLSVLPPETSELLFEKLNYDISPRADDQDYRLPNNTEPIHYDVTLSTNVHTGDRAFNGTVVINVTIVEDTRVIVLHARQLDNFQATVKSSTNVNAPSYTLNPTYELTREFLTLTPSDNSLNFVKNTMWTLTINYNGTLRTDNGGFYLSTYQDENSTLHYLATTQFESTNARHAFPCYDEPAKRATFAITIRHSPTYSAVSNMPVDEGKSSTGVTAFQTTLKMSSYLIAFIVSEFEYTEGSLGGLKQRVYSRLGTASQQQWGLISGLLVEESLAYYFGVPFALPKLDQAAIPDFAAGAMENWGLATYREQYMLYTRENSTVNSETNNANIIGHEYAHMWFGDLVSIKWWTYLWLKEGFATLFSYESNDIAFPEWNVYQLYHVSDYISALNNDAYLSATPMTHYVQKPNEISARYNTFSYAKPSAVLFMFKNAWTDKVFRLGLHKYLTKNRLNSCDEWDLFAALQEAANEEHYILPAEIGKIFSSWSQQAGYPLLTVSRNYQTGGFVVTQDQYLNYDEEKPKKTWYVPLNYAVSSNPDFRDTSATHWILNVTDMTVDAKISNNDWLIVNKQSTGYYRVNYDERNWNLIAEGLVSTPHLIHPRNRAQLLHDAYRFMNSRYLQHSSMLHLLSYIRNEDQYAPWSVANSIFNVFDMYLRGDAQYHQFRYFVIELVDNIFQKVGVHDVSGEQHLVKYLRNVLISLACSVGSDNCYQLTNNKLKEFINDNARIEPNVKTQIFCNGLRQSADSEYNFIFAALTSSNMQTDRSLYLSSLGCSQKESQIKKFVESSIDVNNQLTSFERTQILSSAYSRSEVGLTVCLEFLETNWEAYGKLGSDNTKPLDSALKGMAQYVVSDKQNKRLNALVDNVAGTEYVNIHLKESVQNSIQANFNWLDTNRDPLMNWVITYRSGSSSLTSSIMILILGIILIIVMREP